MKLEDDYVPLRLFGKDHWSTLAYAETVMVEVGGFQVGFDGRMRQGRAHFRVMQRDCPEPKRPRGSTLGVPMDLAYSTRLRDGTVVEGHDDWHCVQDFVNAGIMGIRRGDGLVIPLPDEVDAGVTLFLTPYGEEMVARLRAHKAKGGQFAGFVPEAEEAIG